MKKYIEEVDGHFDVFFNSLPNDMTLVMNGLNSEKDRFRASYRRLVSLQAWRSELIEKVILSNAEEFFKEAQNDALMSHALARQGAWRVALMSLRSCIENTLFGLYYCDHPVELALWEKGMHKLGFTETVSYLSKHPEFSDISEQQSGIEEIKSEYAILSKAVHGSSKPFRMTKHGSVEGLNINSVSDFGSWLTREKQTLIGLNTILIAFFKNHLTGAANINLRKALSLVIPEPKHPLIKANLGVKLRSYT